MTFGNSRFALLAVFCCLAIQSFSPFGDASVRAAVVHRQPRVARQNGFVRHDIGKKADHDASLHHDQALFSFPASRRDAPSVQCNEVKRCQKKRSIAISNVHGSKSTVNHRRRASTPQWISVPQNGTNFNNTASTTSSSDTGGTVAILSHNSNPDNDRVVASLFLVKQPDGKYVLDASDRNATEMFLTAVPRASSSDNETYPVKLSIPTTEGTYCATYDENPPTPEPLTAQRCTETGVHESQIFMYNRTSGNLQPTSFVAQDVEAEDVGTPSVSSLSPPSASPSSASMGAANAGVIASSDSAFPTPSAASPSSASWGRRDDSGSYSSQNVTLVFVPKRTVANETAAEVQEALTSTVTSTVTVYSSAASVSSPAVNAVDPTPSASSASVLSSAVNAADATPSASSVSGSRSAAMAGVTGLSVEVVGNALSSAADFSSVSMAAAASGSGEPASSPAASNSPSPSLVAAAAATSVSASYSASPSSDATSPSAVAVASLSPSDSASVTSMSSSPASSSARAMFERNEAALAKVTPVSTEPYRWRFKADGTL